MAFVPKEWKDRLVEFAGRRKLTNVSTGEEMIVDVARNEGAVSQEGDAFSAANMNDLEQRVSDEFNNINTNLTDKISFDTYELLWSNPTETYKAETVSVDLSKYKAILLMETKNTTVIYSHALIPISIFKLGLDHEASHYFEGERVCLYAKYNSDTSIYCSGYGYVYGIK